MAEDTFLMKRLNAISLTLMYLLCPRVVLLWGLLEHFCGYSGLWLAATGRLVLPYWAMVGLTVMAFNGSNWIDTACIATNVQNFPTDRGTVVGE